MRAIDVIRMAQQCGVRIGVEGDDLILDADREPAPQVLDAIRRHKANVVALLSGSPTENDYRVRIQLPKPPTSVSVGR